MGNLGCLPADASSRLASGLASAFSGALNQAFGATQPAAPSSAASSAAAPSPASPLLQPGKQQQQQPAAAQPAAGSSKVDPLPSQPDTLERQLNKRALAAAADRSSPTKPAAASAQSPAPARQPSADSSPPASSSNGVTQKPPAANIKPGPEPAAGRSKADDFPYMRDVAGIASDINAKAAAKKTPAPAQQKPAAAAQEPPQAAAQAQAGSEAASQQQQEAPASRIKPAFQPEEKPKGNAFPYMAQVKKIAADITSAARGRGKPKQAQTQKQQPKQAQAQKQQPQQEQQEPAQSQPASRIRPGPEPAAGRSKADDFPYMCDVAGIASDINAEAAAKKTAQQPSAPAQKPAAPAQKSAASAEKPAAQPAKAETAEPQPASRIRPGPEPAAGRSKADDFPYMRNVANIAADINAETAAKKAAPKPAAATQKPAKQPATPAPKPPSSAQEPPAPAQKPPAANIKPGPEPAAGRSKADDFPYMRDVASIASDINAETAAKKAAPKPAAATQKPEKQPATPAPKPPSSAQEPPAPAQKPPAANIKPGPEPAAGRSKADDFPYMRDVAGIAADINAESAAKKPAPKSAAATQKPAQQPATPAPKPPSSAQKPPAPDQKPPAANIKPGPKPAAGRSKADDFPYMRDVAGIAADINAEAAAKKPTAAQPSQPAASPPAAGKSDSVSTQQQLAKQAQADTAGRPANFSQGQGEATEDALAGAKKLPVDPLVPPTPADDPAEGRKNFADAVQEVEWPLNWCLQYLLCLGA